MGLQAHDPAVAVRVAVDDLRVVRQVFVHGLDDAGDRRVHIRCSLDRLDDRHVAAGIQFRVDFRQFDIDEIAQRGLRMIGDADRDAAVIFATQPLVFLGVQQVSG